MTSILLRCHRHRPLSSLPIKVIIHGGTTTSSITPCCCKMIQSRTMIATATTSTTFRPTAVKQQKELLKSQNDKTTKGKDVATLKQKFSTASTLNDTKHDDDKENDDATHETIQKEQQSNEIEKEEEVEKQNHEIEEEEEEVEYRRTTWREALLPRPPPKPDNYSDSDDDDDEHPSHKEHSIKWYQFQKRYILYTHIIAQTKQEYKNSWIGFFPSSSSVEEEEEEGSTTSSKMKQKSSEIQDNLQRNVGIIRDESSTFIQKAKVEASLYSKEDVRKWAGEQMKLATECVSEFMGGYRDGRDDEVDKMLNEYFQELEGEEEKKEEEEEEGQKKDKEEKKEEVMHQKRKIVKRKRRTRI